MESRSKATMQNSIALNRPRRRRATEFDISKEADIELSDGLLMRIGK